MKITESERWILANQYQILTNQAKILMRLSNMESRDPHHHPTDYDHEESERVSLTLSQAYAASLALAYGVEDAYEEHCPQLSLTIDAETSHLVDEIVEMFQALARGIADLGLEMDPTLWQFRGFHPPEGYLMSAYMDYLLRTKRAQPQWFPKARSEVPELARYRRMLEVYRDLHPKHSLDMKGITALVRLNVAGT